MRVYLARLCLLPCKFRHRHRVTFVTTLRAVVKLRPSIAENEDTDTDTPYHMSLASLLMHAAPGAAAPQLPSLDAKCTGASKYVSSSTYSARISTWGQVGRGGWRGAVLGPDGKIYGIPTNATSVLKLDPVTRKVTTFGDFGTALAPANCSGALHCGLEKWIGGVLAPTGKIIGIPCALRPAPH